MQPVVQVQENVNQRLPNFFKIRFQTFLNPNVCDQNSEIFQSISFLRHSLVPAISLLFIARPSGYTFDKISAGYCQNNETFC